MTISQIRKRALELTSALPMVSLAGAGLVLSGLADTTAAHAQETGSTAASGEGEVIIVTGSRILRPDLDAANPIVSVTEEAITQSGQTNITELLSQTPALFNSEGNYEAAGSQARFGGTGVNLLNLRNLGAKRTLVLVNGRRHISGIPGEAGVDTNTIPVALIERVDVLTGGVSAIYGADGVSGVVNFVMKQDFEGLDVRAQNGLSDYGDAGSHLVSVTAGKNFAGGRGNITASYEFRQDDRVAFADRPVGYPGAGRFVRNPDDIPDDPDTYDYVFLPDIRYFESSPAGAIAIDDSLGAVFRGDGEPYDLGRFLPQSGFLAQGGDNTPVAAYQGDLQPRTEFHTANLYASYELTPTLRAFLEGKYVRAEAFSISQPSFDFYTYIPADNPFIPSAISNSLAPGNLAGLGYDDGVISSRDNFDLGTRNERNKRDLYRGVLGLAGDLTDYVQFELSYVYGQNDVTFRSENYRLRDRFYAALDAVDEGLIRDGVPNGNIVCRVDITGQILTNNVLEVLNDDDPLNDIITPQTFTAGPGSGCAPLNIFGENVRSQEALNFINVDLVNRVRLKQHVVNGFISGDFGRHFELPGGPIRFALGGEYCKESSDYRPDPIATQSTDYDPTAPVLQDLAILADEVGAFDVWEAFGELNVPVLTGVPFAERLEFGAAIRFSDYSTIGSTTTWKVDGTYSPIRDIAFRASYSEAVRAPNITELFAPSTGAFAFLSDPCSPDNISQGTEFRAGNCEALITGLGVDFDSFDFESSVEASASLGGRSTGNRELQEEKARTWTAGAVFRPSFIPGLALSFDWYDIRLTNAINTASLQRTAEFCVDSETLDNVFCENITRSTVTGYVTDYVLRPENVAFFETAGADATISYTLSTANLGSFGIRGTVGYLDKLNFLPANGGIVDVDRGEAGAPKWVGTADITWQKDNFSVNYGANFVGKQRRYEYDVTQGDPDYVAPEHLYFDAALTHDIRVELATDDSSKAFYVGANNFTNEKPGLGSANTPVGFLGRFFYAGVRLSSADIGF